MREIRLGSVLAPPLLRNLNSGARLSKSIRSSSTAGKGTWHRLHTALQWALFRDCSEYLLILLTLTLREALQFGP